MGPITVTARTGQQVEGIELNETLRGHLFGQDSDSQAVLEMIDLVRTVCALSISMRQGIPIDQAIGQVDANSRRIH